MKLVELEDGSWVFDNTYLTSSIEDESDRAIEYWEAGNTEQAENLFRSVIARCPSHIDAIHHLSLLHSEMGRELDAYLCSRAAVCIGLEAIPDNFSWKSAKIEWGHLENRPFMRAYYGLAIRYLDRDEHDQAITILNRLLSINPNDNLGCRYLLPRCMFATGSVTAVIEHCEKYLDDISPEILFSYPLALALNGQEKEAEKSLKNALQTLPLVGKELAKKRHTKPKSHMPGYITVGGHDQAYEYWKQYGSYWKNSESASKLLNNAVNDG